MYPYFYPSYFNPNTPVIPGTTPIAPVQPGTDELPPVPGKTAASPVEPTAPAPVTTGPPPVDFIQEPGPPVTTDIGYTQAYLKTQIGKKVRVEFLIGTNLLTDRIGTLVGVGISYILIRLAETDDILLGDIYSIKFVTFLE